MELIEDIVHYETLCKWLEDEVMRACNIQLDTIEQIKGVNLPRL